MVKRQETLNSLAGIKISSWKSCGQKPDLETFSLGMKSRTRRKGSLRATRPLDELQMTTRQIRSRRATKKWIGMKQNLTTKLYSDGEDRTLLQCHAVDWTSKVLYVLEFKRTSDQGQNYRERGENRARAQHGVLVKSLEKVAGEAVGENSGWKIKLLIFVGGTCGSVHVQTLNDNLRELGVLESKRNTIRRGLVHELLNAQDTVLCSYFAQRSGARGEGRDRERTVEEAFQGLDYFE